MDDLDDVELRRTDSELTAAPPHRSVGVWIAAALLVAAAAVAFYVAFHQGSSAPAGAPKAAPRPAPAQEARPLGGPAEAIDVPPLDESDAVVRKLVEALSRHPAVLAWLATPDLIRNFTVSVVNVADGASPAQHLAVLRPKRRFAVVERGGAEYIDPTSYDRYNALADAVRSIDAVGAARLYSTLKPRIGEAYRDLGVTNQPFDTALRRAIIQLLETPVVEGPVRLRHKGIGFRYDDDRLEQLRPAQKQLLRMGPRNVAVVKASLRAIALALGISANELPPLTDTPPAPSRDAARPTRR